MGYPSDSVEWQDERGRYFRVQLLDKTDTDLSHGYVIGPPLELWDNLKSIPEQARLRLWNELYYRGILTETDAARRPNEVEAALKSALQLDAGRVMEAYRGDGDEADL